MQIGQNLNHQIYNTNLKKTANSKPQIAFGTLTGAGKKVQQQGGFFKGIKKLVADQKAIYQANLEETRRIAKIHEEASKRLSRGDTTGMKEVIA